MASQDQAEAAASSPGAATASLFSDRYVRWSLVLLLVIFSLNFLDRQIVTILAEDLRRDLGLDDWHIGAVSGMAFALFYTILGIPIARLSDRGDRVTILSVSLAVWSGFTALCGMAQNFTHLLLARIGVGIGEAGCSPAAHSLIADMVPQERRARAIAFYGLGIPIGSLLGLVMGGLVADAYGWRTAFFIAGVPGVLLAVFTWFVLREPRRDPGFRLATSAPQVPFMRALKQLMGDPTFVLIACGGAVAAFVGYGQGAFTPAFFQRIHGLSAGETGIWLGITGGIGGIIGTWVGGVLADRFGAKDPRMFLFVPAIGMAIASVTFTPGMLHHDWRWAIALIWIPGILNSLWYGPAFSTIQRLVEPRMRAMAAAVMLFVVNLIGLGLGPLMLGLVSDTIREVRFAEIAPTLGHFAEVCARGAATASAPECAQARAFGLRWSLIIVIHLGLVSALLFWLAGRRMAADRQTGGPVPGG
jgi:MFS transporter, Spinster family, sphingosine-1-phosphate transporter